ncbi:MULTISPECIES: CoA transferase subunit A [Acidianus]|uniref:CoA-transferase n=1 Tax=Candidatus Acidianus copahuensis TaxID=1160895 RepID=A0A031LNJ6_9CREN|nr:MULTISPECIES: CoA-transferase [Acidianus]EZQ04719.1 CoA-transferase [Candidatus Acidianus copahuensis]NON62327.1 CoA transferase subunit A [Acidianus sp. RZ1]
MENKLVDIRDALDLIKSGDTITVSGVSIHRNPMSMVMEIVKDGPRNLGFIDREPGLALEVLLSSNVLRKVRVAMATLEWFGMLPSFRKKIENEEVEFLEDTCGAFMAGIRAGAFGIPFMPVKGILGSDLISLHEKVNSWKVVEDPFSNEKIVLVKAITPDVAIIHVNKADIEGNAEIEGPVYEDEFKARASKKVIVTTEEIVDKNYFKKRRPSLIAEHVTAVINSPRGAEPTSMFPLYDADYDEILKILKQA